ncbi:hypothetical protein GS3922_14165 [Geobacillus subterraneus]|uniref:Coiled-coil protein n=2 Tax=Geobacillus TaxID=129337 RepID=A0ABM6AE93_9BACL|nr:MULTISPECIES: hypothetical protein [Geobacillus]AMX84701.1 hypothetical protein GS3922_14165 [Geobacillus subterraneus]KZS25700.1 hypothetical protein A5418_09130 [Geobacillus subterraneus]OXB85523.1 hypothetical protein B9L21_14260 [Geobacillus uzenensis]
MEALLRKILHEVKATRTAAESLKRRVGALEGQVAQLNERTSALETQVAQLNERTSALETQVAQLNERTTALETQVAQLNERASALEQQFAQLKERTTTPEQRIDLLYKRTAETKAVAEALRHGQEGLTANYEAMANDLHQMKGDLTHVTSIREDKVLPALAEHEAGLHVLNARVFKTESILHHLVHA